MSVCRDEIDENLLQILLLLYIFTFSESLCVRASISMKWRVLADVSWQRTRTLMLSGNNAKQWVGHHKIIVTQEFTVCYEKAPNTSVTSRAKELFLTLLLFACPFLVVRPPSLYAAAHFSDVIACPALPSRRDWRARKSEK